MTDQLDRPIGERIAIFRRRRGLSQAVVAGLVGRSESWLSQVERGTRSVDRLSVLIDLSKVLHVDIAILTGQPFELGPNGAPGLGAVAEIRAVVNDHRFEPSDALEVRDVNAIEEAVAEGQRFYQAAQYTSAGTMVPMLIRRAEAATRVLEGDERRRAYGALATTYHLVAALLSRTGETELGWVTADRSIRAAEAAESPDLIAAGLYRLGHVMLRAGRSEEAHSLAVSAAVRAGISDPAGPARASLCGALLLIAAVAAARNDDRREALRLLRAAERQADELGEDRNDHWTAFGPTNVWIHATSSAVELGDPDDVLRYAETVDTERLAAGLRGRRSHVHINLAWAYGQKRNDPATVLSLLEAERIAPEVLRYNVGARELLRECLKRERRTATPGLRGLADRVGVTT